MNTAGGKTAGMRYTAEDSNQGWRVRDEKEGRYITGISESEAEIIAFALKAVADGHDLCAIRRDGLALVDRDLCYEGPVEGVAP